MTDNIFINANIAILNENNHIQILSNSFLKIEKGMITAINDMAHYKPIANQKVYDIKGQLITAGLIDCHTHLVYGGHRALEFEDRLNGVSYADIAKRGGGIHATIKSTREESFDTIYHSSAHRLKNLMQEGVTTIEIKSGYGLDTKNEIKMLQIAKALADHYPIHIEKTFLGAHTTPPEYSNNSQGYINYICNEMLDEVHNLGLASSVDAYCEHLAFDTKEIRQLFNKAKDLGLAVKLHADQFSQMQAVPLACEFDALSVDHLEYTDEQGVKAMAKHKTSAVLLPGAYYMLREQQKPPIKLFRDYGVPMAVATDLNPGTSPLCSLHLAMNMASVCFGLTIDEVFCGVTKNAALALGLSDRKGEIKVGYDADLAIWNISHPRELIAALIPNRLSYRVVGGEVYTMQYEYSSV